MRNNGFKLGNTALEVVRNAVPAGAQGEAFMEKRQKQSKKFIN